MKPRLEASAAQPDSKARECFGASVEVAGAKSPEETLGEEGAVFRALVEQEIAGIYIISADGTLAYVNPYFARVFGYELADAVGRPMLEFVAEPERAAVSERFAAQMTGREQFSDFNSTLLRKDGAPVDVLIHSNVATFGGQPASIGVILDISERKRAEERLREEEGKFRGLAEQNVAGAVIVRDDGTIGYCNGYFAHLIGCAPEEVVGRRLLDFVPETDQPIVDRSLRSQLVETGAPVQIGSTMRARDGSIVEVLVNASKGKFEGDSASIAVVIDVTERNRAQRKLASTAAMLATEHESSPDGILVVDPMARIISVNRRFGQIFDIPAELLGAGDDEQVRALVSQRVADVEAFQRRVQYLYDHPEESGQDELILKNGRVLDRYSSPFRNSDGDCLGRLWFFRDITSLRTSEERFRLLVEEAPDAILLFDYDQDRFIAANKAAEHLFGVARDQILAHGPQHFYSREQPDARPVAQSYSEHNDRALAGEQITYERRIRQASGEERLCEVTLVRLPSNVRLLRASFVDITERNRAQTALQRLNRTHRTLSAAGTAVVRATTEKELLDDMCRVAVEIGGYRLAWIGFVHHDEAKTVRPVAWAGEHPEFVQAANISWAETARGRGPTGTAVRTGEVQVNQNAAVNPALAPWSAEMLRYDLKSSIALPLKNRLEVFGTLTFYSAESDAFGPEEVMLLKQLAADLAYGISAQRDHAGRESALLALQENLKSTVQAIATAVEMRDAYTAGHQRRVADLATAIAREIGLKEEQIEGLYLAAAIHDVGKINVPAELLSKPGKLTSLEYQILQTHVQTGYEIIKGIQFPWPIAQIILQHHERLDGSGYPQGLKDEAILPEAKILSVADVMEAMLSHRPYRPALGLDAALAEIEAGKGRLYDQKAVEGCVDLFRRKGFTFQ
ncbi:MAG: PAS domain S-box protein [Roseiarcus sp.]